MGPATWLVANPYARQGRARFDQARTRLPPVCDLQGINCPNNGDEFRACLRRGLEQGIAWFAIVGGDGTLSMAANELAGQGAVMIPLPAGTGNTFAWAMNLPRRLDAWVDMVRDGHVERIDVGVVEAGGESRLFLNSATIGVTSTLLRYLTESQKRRFGLGAWMLEIGRALKNAPMVDSWIQCAEGGDRFQTRQLVIVNGSGLAGPLGVAGGRTAGRDGLLEVFSVGSGSAGSMLRVAARILVANHRRDPAAHFRRASQFDVFTTPALPMDIDGEPWHSTPARFSVRPLALQVLVPRPSSPQRRS